MEHLLLLDRAETEVSAVYVQARAGHSQASVTERYLHAAQVLSPGAAEKAENRIFGQRRGVESRVEKTDPSAIEESR